MNEKGKKYFIQEHLQKTVFHGGVGNIDIERTLLASGFIPIEFPFHYDFSFRAKCVRYFFLLKMLYNLPRGAIVFFQFPLYARLHKLLLKLLRLRPSISVICLVADINGLKDGDPALLKEEIRMLSAFRYFIVHGKPMENWLKKEIPSAITSSLLFFDFLAKPAVHPRIKSPEIAFAGNLAKSPFLEQLHHVTTKNSSLVFHIYGPEATEKMKRQPQVQFCGIYLPYEMPSVLEGSFGLLWDGESIDGAGGSLGEYMQYISHHKLSLYILAGLPMIVYAHAGSAELVTTLQIGFTVESIRDIPKKVEDLSEEDYQRMRENMKPIADRISKGGRLHAALDELYAAMGKRSGNI